MSNWQNGGFFSRVKGNLIKWWQLVVLPVLRINNNSAKKPERFITEESEKPLQNGDSVQKEKEVEVNTAQHTENSVPGNISVNPNVAVEGVNGEDLLEILNRINKEKERERLQEIEKARQKAEEQERIASIMNANKVDVNAFIEAGKAAIESNREKPSEEDLKRAQEIMDRLNREAAEDEAKKQAEIEEARKKAQETLS